MKFDVVFMGGGLSASVLAISILRERPETRVAIIEAQASFPKKVGESASDITAIFMRRFGIMAHLENEQVRKTGLRFWFNDGENRDLSKCSEYSSPSFLSEANGFQFRRDKLDEYLLGEAERLGARIYRPAQVKGFRYEPFESEVRFSHQGQESTIQATWLVDASGRRGLVAQQMKWRKPSQNLPTSASWAHFKGLEPIAPWDGMKRKEWTEQAIGPRENVTGHFMGKGYWIWHIPLSDGTVSLGLVYHQELLRVGGELARDLHPKDAFLRLLKEEPVLRELTRDASFEGFRHLPHLPYTSERYSLPGLALVGDAAAFVDPMFSPGIELTLQQSLWLAPLIREHLDTGVYRKRRWVSYERTFARAFQSRHLVYESRYALMGDFELFSCQTQLDFAGYFGLSVIPSVIWPSLLKYPVASPRWLQWLYRAYCRHLVRLAEKRERTGIAAKRNLGGLHFSRVGVPTGWRRYTKALSLTGIWLARHAGLMTRHVLTHSAAIQKTRAPSSSFTI